MSGHGLLWYWHRLRAMDSHEVAAHFRRKLRQRRDARWRPGPRAVGVAVERRFPGLPAPGGAPAALREELRRDGASVLNGHWQAFGHLEIRVDDPPVWHRDYLAGKDLPTDACAFRLDHRSLPGGADIKLIWELSRWHALARLAMAAYVLDDPAAAAKCVSWLADWVEHNPPFRGWNWTSPLETGLRLVQFAWIDALLAGCLKESAGGILPGADRADLRAMAAELVRLREAILPAHVHFTWRYRSVGSSANNHLIGELSGLIVAVARWPDLEAWAASLERLQALWEREVLAQFAADGGNREQALHYHLFSWEFCWQTRLALKAAGRGLSAPVEERLRDAARFFLEAQVRREPWDYGDSDGGFVTPLCLSPQTAVAEWRDWLRRAGVRGGLDYWLGDPPVLESPGPERPPNTRAVGEWWHYRETGMAVCESGYWFLRWDLSPLGYLKTRAHGHLDALHLSIWYDGVALVIDPGTGAYYADPGLRAWLTSREAHNGPCPEGGRLPRRLGPFLWSGDHAAPELTVQWSEAAAEWALPGCRVSRTIRLGKEGRSWAVSDRCRAEGAGGAPVPFTVRWQFAPGSIVKRRGDRRFLVSRRGISLEVEAGPEWEGMALVESPADRAAEAAAGGRGHANGRAGVVSPGFRRTEFAPYAFLWSASSSDKPCVFRTTFLASREL